MLMRQGRQEDLLLFTLLSMVFTRTNTQMHWENKYMKQYRKFRLKIYKYI